MISAGVEELCGYLSGWGRITSFDEGMCSGHFPGHARCGSRETSTSIGVPVLVPEPPLKLVQISIQLPQGVAIRVKLPRRDAMFGRSLNGHGRHIKADAPDAAR